jgi:hypothetical protein
MGFEELATITGSFFVWGIAGVAAGAPTVTNSGNRSAVSTPLL